MIRRIGPASPHRSGAVIVELAVIAPLFVFFAIGMVELSRGIMVKQILSDAARRSCRLATMPGCTNTSLASEVKTTLEDNNLSTDNVSVTILVNGDAADITTAEQDDKISVRVTIPYSDVGWMTPFFVNGNVESEQLSMLRSS
jgi:Flp pilus assembly protein TadG